MLQIKLKIYLENQRMKLMNNYQKYKMKKTRLKKIFLSIKIKLQGIQMSLKIVLIKNLRFYLIYKYFQLSKQSERISKQKSALQNKKIVSREFQLSKLLKYQARQIIPEYRKYERNFKQKYSALQNFQINWFHMVFILQLADALYQCLHEIKKAYHIKASGMLLAWRWKTNFFLIVKRNGNTIQERSIHQSKLVLQTYARYVKKKQKYKAIIILQSVLNQTFPVISLKNSMLKVRSLVLKVQFKFKWLKNQKRFFFDRFWKSINQVYFQILSELQNKGKLNLEKPVMLKRPSIYLIDTNAMIPLVEAYLLQIKKNWLDYIHYKRIKRYSIYSFSFPSQFDKLKAVAFQIKEPKLFRDPSIIDLTQIIEQYALIKNLI